jgi:hypothetical protein
MVYFETPNHGICLCERMRSLGGKREHAGGGYDMSYTRPMIKLTFTLPHVLRNCPSGKLAVTDNFFLTMRRERRDSLTKLSGGLASNVFIFVTVGYKLDRPGFESRQGQAIFFSILRNVHTASEAIPSLLFSGYGVRS